MEQQRITGEFYSLLAQDKRRECEGKVAYGHQHTAERAVIAMERKNEGEYYSPYGCRFCGKWHIGHARSGEIKQREEHMAKLHGECRKQITELQQKSRNCNREPKHKGSNSIHTRGVTKNVGTAKLRPSLESS